MYMLIYFLGTYCGVHLLSFSQNFYFSFVLDMSKLNSMHLSLLLFLN